MVYNTVASKAAGIYNEYSGQIKNKPNIMRLQWAGSWFLKSKLAT